jgi:transposase
MTAPSPEKSVPKVIGVDDFAFKRGQSYGTIIVDLERGKPIDLLEDRHANTLEAWLKDHPSVEIISRDRSTEYAKACEQGAPKAIQVLDRWHVLKNLREALERVITRHRAEISAAVQPRKIAKDPSRITSAKQEKSAATLEERTHLHTEIHRLAAHGVGQREMAIHLGVSRESIRRYSRSAAPPKRRTGQRKSKGFGEFEAYMLERWAQGNRNAMLLWREIRGKGFVVAKHRIAFWMRQRIALEREGIEPLQTKSPGKPVLPKASRQLVWLLLKEPDVLEVDELTHVNLIVQASPVMKAAREFALEFQRSVRARDVKKLEAWFEQVAASAVQDFKSFAKGFDRDKAALFKALELPWSNGPVEGRVNKLKLIKRQGFGRSGFALLRKRVLHAG